MSAATTELTLGFNAATVLEQVRWLPQVRLERQGDGATAVLFHSREVALLDRERQRAEVAVPALERGRVLAEHRDAQPGPLGVKIHLTSPSRVRTAVELIRGELDESTYHWQSASANP